MAKNPYALPARLETKRLQLQQALSRPVIIKHVRRQNLDFRGCLRVYPDRVIIEYQTAQAGYFWEMPTIEQLLDLALAGTVNFTLFDKHHAA